VELTKKQATVFYASLAITLVFGVVSYTFNLIPEWLILGVGAIELIGWIGFVLWLIKTNADKQKENS
jgi:hypothetical protein